MYRAFLAALCLAVALVAPAHGNSTGASPPLVQSWSDTGLIASDDDWSRVPAIAGHRGDGLVSEPGVDPRTVLADGSATPVDVNANRTDPRAVGLAAGITEFELADPVVAIQGSATASAPHLVVALDTRSRSGISVRLALRDIDASAADAIEPVALQYRVGAGGDFTNVSGGYVADATTGPGVATAVTRVTASLPAAADDQPLVQVRVLTTNATGQDEWVGVDDIEITAGSVSMPDGCDDPEPDQQAPAPGRPAPAPPRDLGPALDALRLSPVAFRPARRGPAVVRRGRSGAALSFRLSRGGPVRFTIDPIRATPDRAGGARRGVRRAKRVRTPLAAGGRFTVRGRRGLNRMRFTGRLRGRALAEGDYVLTGVAVDRAGRRSPPASARFAIGEED